MKAMASGSGGMGTIKSSSDVKETFKEKFVPPELSMVNYFMSKVSNLVDCYFP